MTAKQHSRQKRNRDGSHPFLLRDGDDGRDRSDTTEHRTFKTSMARAFCVDWRCQQ